MKAETIRQRSIMGAHATVDGFENHKAQCKHGIVIWVFISF
jgi:hypothetical protein